MSLTNKMSAKKSNVYTRGGDKGKTSLLGGTRVPKHHPRIEAYGTVDELMAHTALLRDHVKDELQALPLIKTVTLLEL